MVLSNEILIYILINWTLKFNIMLWQILCETTYFFVLFVLSVKSKSAYKWWQIMYTIEKLTHCFFVNLCLNVNCRLDQLLSQYLSFSPCSFCSYCSKNKRNLTCRFVWNSYCCIYFLNFQAQLFHGIKIVLYVERQVMNLMWLNLYKYYIIAFSGRSIQGIMLHAHATI